MARVAASQQIRNFTSWREAESEASRLSIYAHREMLVWTEDDGRHFVGPQSVEATERMAASATKQRPAYRYIGGVPYILYGRLVEIAVANAGAGWSY